MQGHVSHAIRNSIYLFSYLYYTTTTHYKNKSILTLQFRPCFVNMRRCTWTYVIWALELLNLTQTIYQITFQ